MSSERELADAIADCFDAAYGGDLAEYLSHQWRDDLYGAVHEALLAPRPDGARWMLVRPLTGMVRITRHGDGIVASPGGQLFVRAGVEKES